MRAPVQVRPLPDGRRLHLQDGPIDLIVEAFGRPDQVHRAWRAAVARLTGLLDGLCAELPLIRAPIGSGAAPTGAVARRMVEAVRPLAAHGFITPMAAVAGAVAEAVLAAMVASAELDRAYVNNGGDIALHLAPGTHFTAGMVDRPDHPCLAATIRIAAADPVRGIATSGRHGRSFSLGIADAVTVLAESAAAADAAATVVANAVDLPGAPGIVRVPAASLDPDSDLGHHAVTRAVPRLEAAARDRALAAGLARARSLVAAGRIRAAALHLQGRTVTTGLPDVTTGLPDFGSPAEIEEAIASHA